MLPLSTSWRNDQPILDVANHVAAPLREAATVHVEQLRPSPAAGRGRVAVARLLTAEDEAAHVADWIAPWRRRAAQAPPARRCSAASARSSPPVIEALESRAIPSRWSASGVCS